MAFSQKELSESPFKNVIGQTLEVDRNKYLYRIETTDFAFIFHYFFEKPQTYTIVDIIPLICGGPGPGTIQRRLD